MDAHKNFAVSTVATAPSPATSGGSLVVASGNGALFPAAPFNCTVWPAGQKATAANAEIVRVTGKTSDTFTIVRVQESSTARSIVVGDQIVATITAKTLTDVELTWESVGSPGGTLGKADSWLLMANETGASVANFTADSGSWSSDGTTINITTAGTGRLRLTDPAANASLILECEMQVQSSGIASGNHIVGLLYGWDGAGTGDPAVELFGTGTTLASGVLRIEQDSTAAIGQISYALSVDTWYTMRLVVDGSNVDIYVNGVFKYSSRAQSNVVSKYVGIIATGNASATYSFRNFKVWRYLLPEEMGSRADLPKYAKVSDQKAQNTAGGTFTSGAWRTRTLNTEDSDTAGFLALAANQITLSAGTYVCRIVCHTEYVNHHQARLQNVTAATTLITGVGAYAAAGATAGATDAVIVGKFTVAASQALEVQHRCETTNATNGFGSPCNFTTEIYAVAEFWKIS